MHIYRPRALRRRPVAQNTMRTDAIVFVLGGALDGRPGVGANGVVGLRPGEFSARPHASGGVQTG